MLAALRSRLTYANVMATIAVFVALGGSSVAAVSMHANSVGSGAIKNDSVRSRDVKDGALRGDDIKNKSIKGRDLVANSITSRTVKDHSLKALDFKAGQLPVGPRGPAGGAAPSTPVTEVQFRRDVNCEEHPGFFCFFTFNGGVSNLNGEYQPVGFYKDGSGIVHIQGSIESEDTGHHNIPLTAFYLPKGYRPAATRIFPSYNDGSYASVKISHDGEVLTSPPGNIAHLSLDGINFRP